MKLREAIEMLPVHIALLTPATQMTFGRPTNLAAIRHQHPSIIIDTVILIVASKLRVQDLPHLANRSR